MLLDEFFAVTPDGIAISREQASHFAKDIAGDFNPLHDPDAKMFCVPGDLLFSISVERYGLHQFMHFDFSRMVDDRTRLIMPEAASVDSALTDADDNVYLGLKVEGEHTDNPKLVRSLILKYVEFSGHTFPDILVPLMAEKNVMINPKRPLVIYDSMEIKLDELNHDEVSLEHMPPEANIYGKKGDIVLPFRILAGGKTIGNGAKYMIVRGLIPYDTDTAEQMVNDYLVHKSAYGGR